METQPIDIREKVSTEEFFLRLRKQFPINSIYYPGSGNDGRLFKFFQESEVFLLDNDNIHNLETPVNIRSKKIRGSFFLYLMRNKPFVFAHQSFSPFRDETFDAVFYNDNHSTPQDFKDMVRVLKVGGLMIVGEVCVGEISEEDDDRLEKVELPFINTDPYKPFVIRQKVR